MGAAIEKPNGYPRILDQKGCLYGQQTRKELQDLEVKTDKNIEKLSGKIEKMTWALVMSAVSLASTAIVLLLK